MAPANGAAGKPGAKVAPRRTTTSRHLAPVIPVVPLTFPQRPPVPKQPVTPSTTATSPSPSLHAPVRKPTVEERTPVSPQPLQVPSAEKSIERGPNLSVSTNDNKTPSESAAPTPNLASSIALSPASAAWDGQTKDTPTAPSASIARTSVSPAPIPHPPASALPPSGRPVRLGPVNESGVAAPHPGMINRQAFHQPHNSNASLVFGGFFGSNASSPAPHTGASGFAPPSAPPYPPVSLPVAPLDAYGRPLLVSPTVDGYPPTMLNHPGPPTPHSFQGSQSSNHPEELNNSQFPAVNSQNGYSLDPAGIPMNGAMHAPAPMVYEGLGPPEQTIEFLCQGLGDSEFHDCIMEVHFPDSPVFRNHPMYKQLDRTLRTQAHRYILSQSPTLALHMRAHGTPPGGVIVIDIHDEWMRPDVFWYALRTLYGSHFSPRAMLPSDIVIRDVCDDFKLALSYVATARYLRLGWVHSVTAQRAYSLVRWETVELACKFLLPQVTVPSPSGLAGVEELLSHVVEFLVNNFPVNLVLDRNAADPGFSRLPPAAALQPSTPITATSPVARSTSGGKHGRQFSQSQAHLPGSSRISADPRLSQIKFGDIGPSSDENSLGAEEPVKPARAPTANDSLFSRILLNLPFKLLKQVLEHPMLGNHSGQLGAQRFNVISEIIAEREARRLRALETSDSRLRDRLRFASVPLAVEQLSDVWVNSMGFREEVFVGDLPYLVHTWTQGGPGSADA